jgi:hypothetical protein
MILLMAIAGSAGGCSLFKPNFSPAQSAYLDKAVAAPLQFTVSEKDLPDAWRRAQDFVEKNSKLRMVRSDEHNIETEQPSPDGFDFGYEIHNTPAGRGEVRIVVNVISNGRGYWTNTANRATRNAHLLAYYIKTGELDSSLLDQ